jgi:hypothetical protein
VSVKPANQLFSKQGNIKFVILLIGSNLIFPLLTQMLNPSIKASNLFCLVGRIVLPLKRVIIISISLLLCVTYLLVLADCEITFPKPKVSFMKYKTLMSLVLCVTTNAKSPLLFTMKQPSPSENPINQDRKLGEGSKLPGK